ncbi:MAG TPA: hypothetical protein VK361_02025 [Rubrobacteraceae bacterium]|nr:hypothetical protein [Rubrobacteraceae bacterium]
MTAAGLVEETTIAGSLRAEALGAIAGVTPGVAQVSSGGRDAGARFI